VVTGRSAVALVTRVRTATSFAAGTTAGTKPPFAVGWPCVCCARRTSLLDRRSSREGRSKGVRGCFRPVRAVRYHRCSV